MDRKYSVILGNLGNTKDRFCDGYKTNPPSAVMLQQSAKIPFVKGIELVGTWDIHPKNVKEMKSALHDLDLTCVSIIPDLFSDTITAWAVTAIQSRSSGKRRSITPGRCVILRWS